MLKPENIKIYPLIGASASGKTTLFELLQRQNPPQVAFAPEAARLYYQQNIVPKEERSSYQNQIKIQAKFIEVLQAAINEAKPKVITDCSPLSSIYYAMLGGDNEKVGKLTDNIRDLLPIYTLFLLLNPSDVEYHFDPNDVVRQETEAERLQVHQNILRVLETLSLPFLLITGTPEERVKQITELIR